MITKFEVGKGYWATRALDGEMIVVVAIGEVDGVPTFAKVKDFGDLKNLYRIDGREFAKIAFKDGVYTASAAVPAYVVEAKRVIDAVIGR